MFKLRRFLKDYKLQLVIGPLCKLIEAILELMIPLITADIIDTGVKNGDIHYVLSRGGLMVLMGALGLGFALVCQKFASIASQGFGTKLRNGMFRHINKFSHAEFDKIGTPSLITRMTNDVNQMQLAVAMLIRLVIRAPFLVIGALVMAMMIDLKLSVIFFVSSALIGIVLYIVMNKSVPYFKAIQKKLDMASLISRENLSGNRVVRAFNKQEYEEERFNKSNRELADISVVAGKISALLNPLTYIISQGAIIFIVWFGSVSVNVGELQTGQIIALVNYMTQILLAMIVLSNLVVIFTKAAASASRINEVFDTEPSVVEKNTFDIPIKKNVPAVEFKNVYFGYHGNGYALKNISFSIEKGMTVGIIGGTGSGKSTLVNLIPRFYDTTEGDVYVFGNNVREYSFKSLRGRIGIVPQKAELFSGTIKENMLWADKNASDSDIESALKTAQAYEFVNKFPEKTEKQLSERGSNLSGGQRQRLTIARALVGKPDILILDDSSSALDFSTEAKLRSELNKLKGDMTIFTVSQRVSSVRYCDIIMVLDNGMLAGFGSHSQLIGNCEIYREICMSQLEKEEAGV